MKKLISFTLALMMILTLATTAFADDATGSITINGIGTEATYSIYKLLDLESYNQETGAYSYTVNSAWKNYFETSDALQYFAIDNAGYAA